MLKILIHTSSTYLFKKFALSLNNFDGQEIFLTLYNNVYFVILHQIFLIYQYLKAARYQFYFTGSDTNNVQTLSMKLMQIYRKIHYSV